MSPCGSTAPNPIRLHGRPTSWGNVTLGQRWPQGHQDGQAPGPPFVWRLFRAFALHQTYGCLLVTIERPSKGGRNGLTLIPRRILFCSATLALTLAACGIKPSPSSEAPSPTATHLNRAYVADGSGAVVPIDLKTNTQETPIRSRPVWAQASSVSPLVKEPPT